MDESGTDDSAAVRNAASGSAGNVIQAHSIGDIHITSGAPPPNTPPRAVPRQLPPPPPAFVNRVEELATLSGLLARPRAGSPLVVVLSGVGGVGKSTTGARWAHEHADRFVDGQLYADVGELRRRGGGVEVSDILAGFLRGLDVDQGNIPPDFAGRTALYRTRTAGRRFLVLLDDVDQAAQVRPLLPPSAESMVIVTSHRRLSGLVADGAQLVPLEPFDIDAGAEMIAGMLPDGRAGADRDDVAELVRLCGGLPMALRVAGARLVARSGWPVRRLVRRLGDERGRLNALAEDGGSTVGSLCDLSYRELSARAKLVYRRAGLHPGLSFRLEVVAAAAGLAIDEVDDALGVLCEENLLVDAGEDRYRLHELIRLHARRCADEDDTEEQRTGAIRRMVGWYLLGAAAADVAVLGNRLRLAEHDLTSWPIPFGSSAEALAWLDGEQTNLLAAVREAATRGWDDTVWQMCEALWAFYDSRKHYADWIAAHRLGVTAAQRRGNDAALARVHNQLARAHAELAEFDHAHDELTLAKAAADRAGDPRITAAVLESVGRLSLARGDHAAAIETFTRSREINRRIPDARGETIQAYHLGQALSGARRHEEAIATLTDALASTSGPSGELLAARIRISLARAYRAMDRDAEALAAVTPAVEITRRRGQLIKECQAVEILAELADRAGDADTALRHWNRVLDIREHTGDPQAEALRRRLYG